MASRVLFVCALVALVAQVRSDESLAELLRRHNAIHSRINRDPAAFEESKQLVNELDNLQASLASQQATIASERKQALSALVQAHRDQFGVLMRRNQFVEALLEVYEIKTISSQDSTAEWLPKLVEDYLGKVEAEIQRLGPNGLFGLPSTASSEEVKAEQNRLTKLMKQVNVQNFDEESRHLFRKLYAQVGRYSSGQSAKKPFSIRPGQ